MSDCIFCKIASGEIPSCTIYEDAHFRAVLDLGPANRGHALIIPKKHADSTFDLDDETAACVWPVVKKVAEAQRSALGCDGVNVVQNNGEAAGQTVRHFHVHVIPRYTDDGQKIGWKPGTLDDETGRTVGALLREAIGQKG